MALSGVQLVEVNLFKHKKILRKSQSSHCLSYKINLKKLIN